MYFKIIVQYIFKTKSFDYLINSRLRKFTISIIMAIDQYGLAQRAGA